MDEKKNDILQQEPQAEAVAMENEPGSYMAYLSLDYIEMVFADNGLCGERDKQQEFIDGLQQKLEDVILQRKGRPGIAWSWMWQDAKGEQHRAVEIIPMKAKVAGLQIVTPDVTGYQELRDKLAALELECAIQKRQINMLAEVLKTNNLISDHGFRTCFDRKPGGLVEQFERMKERENAELSPTSSWQWEKGMLQTADILSSKKAEYLVLRWAQMVNASIMEAKEEWLPSFGGSQSEEDRTAKEMLERYVSQAEEHMNKLFSLADEYSKNNPKQQ